jgi:neural cell adhesion molecule
LINYNKKFEKTKKNCDYLKSKSYFLSKRVYRRSFAVEAKTMASLSSGRAAAIAILVLLHLASIKADSLEILPNGDVHSKPSGVKMMLTCKPKVDNPGLISNMQWLDPLNRVIESRSTFHAKLPGSMAANPDMYTEMHQDNSLSLVFNPLKEEQAGRYVCTANYANTEHFNKSVQINTVDAISWIDAPEFQYPILGEEYKIKCQVSARPAPTVEWYRDGKAITTNNHYIVETHGLKILQVEEGDEGVYYCHASVFQTGEFQERVIRVEVHERPEIEELGPAVEIIEGKDANIPCKARGKPPPKFSWVRSLTKENLTTVDRFGVDSDTGILTITNVQGGDGGEYECIAQNAAGISSTNIIINVIEKPKIMDFLNRTVTERKEVEITCKAYGRPAPEVTFRKQTAMTPFVNGIQPQDDRITLHSITDNAKGETVASLTIQNALRKDDGIYECIATNKVATSYKNGHLTVEFSPSFDSMTNRTEWTWDARPINLTCIAESIPNATIRWRHNDRDIGRSELRTDAFAQFGQGPISTLTIIPYDRRYYGDYKCIANNIHGEASHIFHVREAPRPGDIQQVKMSEISPTTITFDIVPPATDPDLPIDLITVQYKEQGDQLWNDAQNKSWSPNGVFALEFLKPATDYEFRFRAQNRAGFSQWSKTHIERTPTHSVPSKPQLTTRTDNAEYDNSQYTNQYELSWIKPLDNGQPIDFSEIRYCEIKKNTKTLEWEVLESTCKTEHVRGPRSQYRLRELLPNTFYRAEVKVHNILGYGEPGAIQFNTARESSGSTVDYSIVSAGDTSKPILRAIITSIAILSFVI